jgi:hypothetical protein
MRQPNEEDEVDTVAANLQREFADVVPTVEDMRGEVRRVQDRYRDARVRSFVPLLVYRDTRELLARRRSSERFAPSRVA